MSYIPTDDKGNPNKAVQLHRLRQSRAHNRDELFRLAAKNVTPGLFKLIDMKRTLTEAGNYQTRTIQMLLTDVSKKAPTAIARSVRKFLIKDVGYDPLVVKKGIRVVDDKIMLGGSLKDTLDYEFYGIPKNTWPNVKRLRNWVRTVVIPTNPLLKEKYEAVRRTDRPAREGMLQDLTYVIGRSIFENGLRKKSHWYYEKAEELRMAQGSDDPELLTTYKGIKIKRMASRTGHGGISKRWMK